MNKKIMIVEKDSDILFILTHIFEDQGYMVIPFSNEVGVMQKIIIEKPHAVVLDVAFPTSEGTQLCRTIKASRKTRNTPVIVLSTHLEAYQIKEICADRVVGKPFDIATLIETVKNELVA